MGRSQWCRIAAGGCCESTTWASAATWTSCDTQTCEMCQTQLIRYVQVVEHDLYLNSLEVGCVCCEHMTGRLRNSAKPRKTAAWPCSAAPTTVRCWARWTGR